MKDDEQRLLGAKASIVAVALENLDADSFVAVARELRARDRHSPDDDLIAVLKELLGLLRFFRKQDY